MLEIQGLHKNFPVLKSRSKMSSAEEAESKFWALRNINLKVQPGEFMTWLGPSGCGKTTLLRCLAGLENPTEGDILFAGRSILESSPQSRPFHMVFQRYALFPHMSVEENIEFSLRIKKVDQNTRKKRVDDLLSIMDIESLRDRKPSQLSGGQSQRVALARAIVDEPQVLLLDEPLSALDEKIRSHLRSELRSLQKKIGITFLFVTHDQQEALQISDRISVFHQGQLHQVGTPEDIYLRPQTDFVAQFIGAKNKFQKTESYIEYIYPEKIKMSSLGKIQFEAEIQSIDYLGKDSEIKIAWKKTEMNSLLWKVLLPSETCSDLKVGQSRQFSFNPQDLIKVPNS